MTLGVVGNATKVIEFACSFGAKKWILRDNEGQFKAKIISLKLS